MGVSVSSSLFCLLMQTFLGKLSTFR